MSFSAETKNELARIMPEDRECSLSELSAIIKLSGSIQIAGYKKLNIKVPIDHMGRAQICMTNLEGNVMVGGIPFYKEYRVAHMTDRDEIYIGKSFVIVYANDKENAKLSYRLRGNLNERIVAEEMLIKLAEEKYIYINNVQLEINLSQDELMELKLNEAKKTFSVFKRCKRNIGVLRCI